VFFLSSASTSIFTALTTVMIGIYISDAAQVSYWSLSMTVVAAVQSLFTPFTNSIYPNVVVSRNLAPVRKALKLGFPLVVAGCLALFFCADLVMRIFGGREYVAGAHILQIVIPTILLSFPSMMIGFPVLAAVDREKQLTTSSVVAATFHIAGLVTLALTSSFTIVAVAILRSITEGIMLVLRVAFVRQWRRQVSTLQAADGTVQGTV
jgi:PST family polysaccharide transporter